MSAPAFDGPDAAVAYAIDALKSRDEAAAVPAVAAAAARHPGHARLRQALGMLHRAVGDHGPAIAAFDAAAALAPDDASIARVRARACLEAGRPAVELFERAVRLAPQDGAARLGRASALLAERGPDAAIAALDAELADMPLWADGQALRAKLRWMSGDDVHFAEGLEWALIASPGDLGLWSALLALLAQAGRPEAVLDAVARARTLVGAGALLDLYAASAHDDLGDLAASAQLFETLGEPQHIDVALLKLRHMLRARRPDEAAALAERWAATPARALVWPYLAIAWRLTGDDRLAWLEGGGRLVGVYDLGAEAGSLDALAARLRGLHFARARPLDQSVRGGTQTDGALLSRLEPEFAPLRAAFAAAVRRHLDGLPPVDPDHETLAWRRDRPVRFADSWSVRLAGAGHHANHVHPGGWFSSAFYVALPDAAAQGPDPAGWLRLGAPPEELGLDLPPLRRIEPKPGRLVLFPSTLWHGTEPFAAGERLTIAFDVARPG